MVYVPWFLLVSQYSMCSTTILSVRKGGDVVLMCDGQASLGNTVFKANVNKLRRLSDGEILTGFAGSTADAFILLEGLEEKLNRHPKQLMRASVELAKDWRTDKYLRRLEAMLIVADKQTSLVISGSGDVIEPEDGIIAIGSGGNYALSAARALMEHGGKKLTAQDIAVASMKIAADICVFTNHNFVIEKI